LTTNNSFVKSNAYYNLYFLHKLSKRGITLKYIFTQIYDVLEKNSTTNQYALKEQFTVLGDKTLLFVFCDDVSYSGNQLTTQINPIDTDHYWYGAGPGVCKAVTPSQYFNRFPKSKVFLNVVGLLPSAYTLITSQFRTIRDNALIIPRSVIKFDGPETTVINALDSIDGFKTDKYYENDCYILVKDGANIKIVSQLDNYFSFSNNNNALSLVYLFQKYPDAQSTFGKLCCVPKIPDNSKILNLSKFLEHFRITIGNFKSKFNSNLKTLLQNVKPGVNHDETISQIVRNFEAGPALDWISIVSPSSNCLTTERGECVIQLLTNQYELSRFKGACLNIAVSSFYKNLPYAYDKCARGFNIMESSIVDVYKKCNVRVESLGGANKKFYNKYLKYKNKYLKLKSHKLSSY
jgi:hypothetical protein